MLYGPGRLTIAQVLLDKRVINSREAVSLQLVEYEYATKLLTVANERVWARLLEAESDVDRETATRATVMILRSASRQVARLRTSGVRLGTAKAAIVRTVTKEWLVGIAPLLAEHLSSAQRQTIADVAQKTVLASSKME